MLIDFGLCLIHDFLIFGRFLRYYQALLKITKIFKQCFLNFETHVFEIETQFQSKVVEQLLFNHFYCLNKTKTPPNTCIFVFKWLLLDPNKAYEHYKPIGNLSEMY